MGVRIRRAEFAGQDDKFYAPSDDIRNCFIPITRGALEAMSYSKDETEDVLKLAEILGTFYQDAFLAAATLAELMGGLMEKLDELNPRVVAEYSRRLTEAMCMYYATAQRETSFEKDLSPRAIEEVVVKGTLLARLPVDRRATVDQWLRECGSYPVELDREVQQGVVIGKEDIQT
jgi:hypothetical protein